jgi:TRAP-type C4-dicarboxylate transport system permease small subunit
MLARIEAILGRILETVVIALILSLTAVVVIAVIYRKAGASLSWYDEVASVLLAWVTYYGAALAALKRQHIGFDGLVLSVAPALRLAFMVVAEACVFGFFILLAWTGMIVLDVLEGDTLVSLPQVSVQITQSVMPIGAALFVICEALSLPDHWRRVRAGLPQEVPPELFDEDGSAS